MSKLNVKNGTPVGNVHLCKSCSWGQFMTGYRESDLMVICTNTRPNIAVPFTVFDCSEYNDKYRPDWEQMEKLAIGLGEKVKRKPTPGFFGNGFARVPAVGDEDEDELEEVARN
jgi:hypothetical protein